MRTFSSILCNINDRGLKNSVDPLKMYHQGGGTELAYFLKYVKSGDIDV